MHTRKFKMNLLKLMNIESASYHCKLINHTSKLKAVGKRVMKRLKEVVILLCQI